MAEREVYSALDWLLEQQPSVENALARRHLKNGTLVLYDVSSSYLEGRKCPLAQHGYSRDHRPDRLQIVYGLLCTREGLPVAVEVFDGDAADPTTLAPQIAKLKQRFALDRVVLVGDRGMLTSAASAKRWSRLDWTGFPACAATPSRSWRAMTARCNCRCSTCAIWRRSRRPSSFPANA